MAYLTIYLLIGAFAKLTNLFAFECTNARTGEENVLMGLLATMIAWPVPFGFFVKANFFDE